MSEFRTFHGEPRPPTWAERERTERMRADGVEDVYVDPSDAPREFWNTIMEATFWAALRRESEGWKEWEKELRYATGWVFSAAGVSLFESIVRTGVLSISGGSRRATVGERLGAIEHLIDAVTVDSDYQKMVNDRARHFRVGVLLEGDRFVPLASEHLHTEIVQPTLLLLAEDRFDDVDDLYWKAFERNFPARWRASCRIRP